ncbi:MAG: 4Fe-4S dicluster domain-containing protein [Thermodesulfobacteriota bacterium]
MIVDLETCVGCGLCVEACPIQAIQWVKKDKKKKVTISEFCAECEACLKVCPKGAISQKLPKEEKRQRCYSCPIQCFILEGYTGACQRFINRNGELVRNIPLQRYEDVAEIVGKDHEEVIRKPLITGIGAGTTYPDTKPAPYIVQSNIDGVDVVSVVTEAPLSYSGIKVKIDTDIPIGEEGAPVLIGKRRVGHVCTEEYGSKILSLGGVNLLTGQDGLIVAKTISEIANRKEVKLEVKGGAEMILQVGKPPVINGKLGTKMRVGCGSASMGLFGRYFLEAADEVIVLDSHLIGLFTEHMAGKELGASYSGIKLRARKSTSGRYFGEHGKGWGGTPIENPLDIIEGFDPEVTRPGMTVLITETTGERAALFRLGNNGKFEQVDLTSAARRAVEMISSTCESSRVSAIFIGGAGGSARAGVTKIPLKLNQAIHQNRAKLTVGGAPTYILPGGGITFLVDIEKVMVKAFTYVPTPATVVPLEYTMRLDEYIEIGGHKEKIRKLEEVLEEIKGKY